MTHLSPACQPTAAREGSNGADPEQTAFQRIDGGRPLETSTLQRFPGSREDPARRAGSTEVGWAGAGGDPSHAFHDSLLRLHAADLINRLQGWAEELDAREARLNGQAAQQDLRERQFRTVRQSSLADLREQRRAIERLREALEEPSRQGAIAWQASAEGASSGVTESPSEGPREHSLT